MSNINTCQKDLHLIIYFNPLPCLQKMKIMGQILLMQFHQQKTGSGQRNNLFQKLKPFDPPIPDSKAS